MAMKLSIWFLLWFFLAVAFLSGCSDKLTTAPTIYVDSSFSPDETQWILHGPDEWERVGALSAKIVMVSHGDAMKLGDDLPDNSVTFIRNDCPSSHDEWRDACAATWKSGWNGSAVTCVNASVLKDNAHYWRATAVHELGHAYNLEHDTTHGAVVMWPNADMEMQPDTLQDADLAQWRATR